MRLAPLPLALLVALLVALPATAAEPTRIPEAALDTAAQLRDIALADDTGWKIAESLTTEVGPRMAGSDADARAVAWAKAKFAELGFDKVWTEPVTFPKWERRGQHAEVVGAHAQPLVVSALGGSAGGTIEAEVVRFPDLESLQAAAPGSLAGRIAFVDYRMERARDGHGYGKGSRVRGAGPSAAIEAGAAAFLMRSAGTDNHRFAHTGMTRYAEGLDPIPAAALSNPDADQLARLLALDPATRVRLALDCGWDGEYTSQNVIGEITGSSRPDEVVLIGGHLDSWDEGTGAIDDAAGIGVSMAAARMVAELPVRPARSIRVVAFANEEQGLHGGFAYARAHAGELAKHTIVSESDFGAGRIYGFDRRRRGPRRCRQSSRSLRRWRRWASNGGPAKAHRNPTSGRSPATALRGPGWGMTAAGTSTCTTRPTTPWTRSIRRRWRRTWRPTRCSPTWPRRRKATSAVRPRAWSTKGADHPDRLRQARCRVLHRQRLRLAEAGVAQRLQQPESEAVPAEHTASHRVAVVFGRLQVHQPAVRVLPREGFDALVAGHERHAQQQASAWPQHAREFAQRRGIVRDVLEHVEAGDHVELGIGEVQCGDVLVAHACEGAMPPQPGRQAQPAPWRRCPFAAQQPRHAPAQGQVQGARLFGQVGACTLPRGHVQQHRGHRALPRDAAATWAAQCLAQRAVVRHHARFELDERAAQDAAALHGCVHASPWTGSGVPASRASWARSSCSTACGERVYGASSA